MQDFNRSHPTLVVIKTADDVTHLTRTAQPHPNVLGPVAALAFAVGVVGFVVLITLLKLGQGGF